jgi:hypothetical protein
MTVRMLEGVVIVQDLAQGLDLHWLEDSRGLGERCQKR